MQFPARSTKPGGAYWHSIVLQAGATAIEIFIETQGFLNLFNKNRKATVYRKAAISARQGSKKPKRNADNFSMLQVTMQCRKRKSSALAAVLIKTNQELLKPHIRTVENIEVRILSVSGVGQSGTDAIS